MTNIDKIKMSIKGFDKYLLQGYQNSIDAMLQNAPTLSEADAQQLTYIQNNYETVKGILKRYEPSTAIKKLTNNLQPLQVYIIMENWCGSSAANVPYIVKILETISASSITIVPRDANDEFMNAYLSNGKKSIPIVVAFDEHQKEMFVWGSATKLQTEYASTLQAKNLPFSEFIKTMKIWFTENNAKAIEDDFKAIFNTLLSK